MAVREETQRLNGWVVEDVQTAVEMVKEQPEAGKLTFRTRTTWDGAFGVEGRAEEIEQLGESMPRRFTMRGDHPPELLGSNTGPTAIETLQAALGSCIAGTYAAQALARGVDIEELEVELEGELDLSGFFGLRPVRPGMQGMKATVRVKSDADDATLEELGVAAAQHSPVYDSVSNPVSVNLSVGRKQ